MSIKQHLPCPPAPLIPVPMDTSRAHPCPCVTLQVPSVLRMSRAWSEAAGTALEGSLNQHWNPGSLPRPISCCSRGQIQPTSFLCFIQADKASPLVLQHHPMRFNSCCSPCCIAALWDLSKICGSRWKTPFGINQSMIKQRLQSLCDT